MRRDGAGSSFAVPGRTWQNPNPGGVHWSSRQPLGHSAMFVSLSSNRELFDPLPEPLLIFPLARTKHSTADYLILNKGCRQNRSVFTHFCSPGRGVMQGCWLRMVQMTFICSLLVTFICMCCASRNSNNNKNVHLSKPAGTLKQVYLHLFI